MGIDTEEVELNGIIIIQMPCPPGVSVGVAGWINAPLLTMISILSPIISIRQQTAVLIEAVSL